MKRTKILFIGSHLSNQRGTLGPSEKIAKLFKKEYNITLVSHFENQLIRLLDITFAAIFRDYDSVHIDVFSNRAFYYANIASLIAEVRKKPIIMTLHGGMLAEKYEREPQRIKKVLERADVIQSPSLFLIEFFKKQGIAVNYMPNFIDLSNFPYRRDDVHPYTLLWVRAFSPEYCPELAIMTLFKILPYFSDATLTMVGPDKGLQNEMKDLVKKLSLEKQVRFEGKVLNEQLFHYYQTHAVYLNTTVYESFGIAVLEAASCGIPIVSTRVGEIPYLWKEGEEILMCEAEDNDMAQQVMSIFKSPSLSQKLSVNARQKAESFDWATIKSKWIDLLTNKADGE